MKALQNAVLVLLATLRLSRFVTTDKLGDWLIVRKARDAATPGEIAAINALPEGAEYDPGDPLTWRARLVVGLECPFCVGFWIGLVVVMLNVVLSRLPGVRVIWTGLLTALSLNYIVGHISSRID